MQNQCQTEGFPAGLHPNCCFSKEIHRTDSPEGLSKPACRGAAPGPGGGGGGLGLPSWQGGRWALGAVVEVSDFQSGSNPKAAATCSDHLWTCHKRHRQAILCMAHMDCAAVGGAPNSQHSSIGVGRLYPARFEGNWYIGHWDGVRPNIVLDKSPLMPGEGFRPSNLELQYCKKASRVVSSDLVEVVPGLRHRGVPVCISGLDDSSGTLRLRMGRTNGFDYGEERAYLNWFSPFIDVDDPRLEKGIGELR